MPTKHIDEKTWKKTAANTPPAYAGFSGAEGSGLRMCTNIQKGISPGGDASYDPPGYGATYNRRGHLVANSFGGPGDKRNIVAMTEKANQTDAGMRSIEKDVNKEIQKGTVFNYKVIPDYNGKNWKKDPPNGMTVTADEVWPNSQTGVFSKCVSNTT